MYAFYTNYNFSLTFNNNNNNDDDDYNDDDDGDDDDDFSLNCVEKLKIFINK